MDTEPFLKNQTEKVLAGPQGFLNQKLKRKNMGMGSGWTLFPPLPSGITL